MVNATHVSMNGTTTNSLRTCDFCEYDRGPYAARKMSQCENCHMHSNFLLKKKMHPRMRHEWEMRQKLVEAKNMNIVDFVEKVFHIELFESQKKLLRKMYKAGPDAVIVFPKRSGYTNYKLLSTLINSAYGDDVDIYLKGDKSSCSKQKGDSSKTP